MLSTSALTWAAAQLNIPMWELIRSLNPTDETRIETAYAEWRRRAKAGEKRPRVDWRSYPIPEEPVHAAPVPSEEDKAAIAAEETREDAPISAEEETSVAVEEEDSDFVDAVERILVVEETTESQEYISLDDFNLEPGEAEIRAMDALIRREEPEALTESTSAEAVPSSVAESTPTEVVPPAVDEVETDVAEPAPAEITPSTVAEEKAEAEAVTIEQRISKLLKDAPTSVYEDLLAALGNDVEMTKMVVEAVIKDHTRRHRGTAAQRAFFTWLEKQ